MRRANWIIHANKRSVYNRWVQVKYTLIYNSVKKKKIADSTSEAWSIYYTRICEHWWSIHANTWMQIYNQTIMNNLKDAGLGYKYICIYTLDWCIYSPFDSMLSRPPGNWIAAPKPPSLTGAELSTVASNAQAGRMSLWRMSFSWQYRRASSICRI